MFSGFTGHRPTKQKPNSLLSSASVLGLGLGFIGTSSSHADDLQTIIPPQFYKKTEDGQVVLSTTDGQMVILNEGRYLILEDGLLIITDELAQRTIDGVSIDRAFRTSSHLKQDKLTTESGGIVYTQNTNAVRLDGSTSSNANSLSRLKSDNSESDLESALVTSAISSSGIALALVSNLFSGRNTQDDEEVSETSNPETHSFQGQVVKGPLNNAFVFLDANSNTIFDDGEQYTRTDSSGRFSLSSSNPNVKVIVQTDALTTDSVTGARLPNLKFEAPAGSTLFTPLTSLLSGTTLTSDILLAVLGLPSGNDLATYNPYGSSVDPSVALEIEKTSLQITSTLMAFAASAEGAGISSEDAFASAQQALINIIQTAYDSQQTLDFGADATLSSLKTEFLAQIDALSGVTADQKTAINAVLDATATATKNINAQIASITNTDLSDPTNLKIAVLFEPLRSQVQEAATGASQSQAWQIDFSDPQNIQNALTNSPPTDLALSSNTIEEGSADLIVGYLSATDDTTATENLVFSIPALSGPNDQASFEIDPSTGALKFTHQPDYETKNSYSVTIEVTDEDGLTNVKNFTVEVIDQNEIADDVTPPTVHWETLPPTVIDLSDGPVTISASGYIQDNLSGVYPSIAGYSGTTWWLDTQQYVRFETTSNDSLEFPKNKINFTYEHTLEFEAPGNYAFSFNGYEIEDKSGNKGTFRLPEPINIEVINSNYPIYSQPYTIIHDVPDVIDLSNGTTEFTISRSISDSNNNIFYFLAIQKDTYSSKPQQTIFHYGEGPFYIDGGAIKPEFYFVENGEKEINIPLNPYTPSGTYYLDWYSDDGHTVHLSDEDTAVQFEIINPNSDDTAPVLHTLQKIDNSFELIVSDDLSGFLEPQDQTRFYGDDTFKFFNYEKIDNKSDIKTVTSGALLLLEHENANQDDIDNWKQMNFESLEFRTVQKLSENTFSLKGELDEFPYFKSGNYDIKELIINDLVGNQLLLTNSDLSELGLVTSLFFENTNEDLDPPHVIDLNFPLEFDNVSIKVGDDVSGVSNIWMSGQSNLFFDPYFGPDFDRGFDARIEFEDPEDEWAGQSEMVLTFDIGIRGDIAPGTYNLGDYIYVSAKDAAGNYGGDYPSLDLDLVVV
jgi:hypothetical protein